MPSIARPAKVLLVGAFERDNFGDLLFYALTKKFLADSQVVAGSIVGADMTTLLGTQVQPHNDLLAAQSWNAVWVVGGEVGGVNTENALAMSLTEPEGAIFDSVGDRGKTALARFLADAARLEPAYLPMLDRFPLNADTPLVLNSVGLGNMAPEGASPDSDIAISALRKASAVVVRDSTSQIYAGTLGVPSQLSPDLVHAISIQFPGLREEATTEGAPYFIFQSNAALIQKYGSERIARSLAALSAETGWHPAFFLAGVARHHDSADQYEGIVQDLAKLAPGLRVLIISTRKPLRLASWIANSQLWVGSSLHGRIVAGAFSKPRVSLENGKVSTYAATWDASFPAGVAIEDLPAAASAAILLAALPASKAASLELSWGAQRSTEHLVQEYAS